MKLGRNPRARDARVPHLSPLVSGISLPSPPAEVDYYSKLPNGLGSYGNDVLGDCTCAATFHAIQAWSDITALDYEPQDNAVTLYSECCGYVPGDPSTDQGGVEQEVLKFWLNTGIPMGSEPHRHRISAYVEVDVRNLDDVRSTIYECGVLYIGFNVPQYVMSSLTAQYSIWNVQTLNDSIIGGHAVVVVGYDALGVKLISWGNIYTMTWDFFSQYVDEAYGLVDRDWAQRTGLTPAGLTLSQLEALMQSLKENHGGD